MLAIGSGLLEMDWRRICMEISRRIFSLMAKLIAARLIQLGKRKSLLIGSFGALR